MSAKKNPNVPRVKADFAWYSGVSRKLGLPPRCPIASAEMCPRYYQSADALGRAGQITRIPSERAAALEQKWKMFEAAIAEEEPQTTIAKWTEEHREVLGIEHFCPEVSYDIFGYFASFMHEYVDEIDRESTYKLYQRDGMADQFDARWWRVTPRHYTECREYSILAAGKRLKKPDERKGLSDRLRFEVLKRDSFTCVYCGRKPPEVTLQVDHKVSVKDGGSDDFDNLVTACQECNGGKGSSSV